MRALQSVGRHRRTLAAALTVGAMAAAPLAISSSTSANAVTISGALRTGAAVTLRYPGVNTGTGTATVHILGFNDFHGQLESGSGLRFFDGVNKYAGGAAYLAKAVRDKQDLYGLTNQATVVAGDSIGASPLASAAYADEPALIAKNMMRLDFASVGNHEFDKGSTELLRQINGCGGQPASCSKAKSLGAGDYQLPDGTTTPEYPGVNFRYLADNVAYTSGGAPLLPATAAEHIKTINGVKIGFIGIVLASTPTIVTQSGVAGLTFTDEITAANSQASALKAAGAQTLVLVIHQGGGQTSSSVAGTCNGNLAGSPILTIAQGLDPAIGVIVSGHTHNEYMCTLTAGGTSRLIGSASSQGKILSDYTLTVDTGSGELLAATGVNSVVESSSVLPNLVNVPTTGTPANSNYVQDPTKQYPPVQAVVNQYVAAVAPIANTAIGKITAAFPQTFLAPFNEFTSGDLIADSQLAATVSTGGAQIAFMNPGGVRSPGLTYANSAANEGDGVVTYGEAFTMQPFGNSMVTKTMTGAQIRTLLEQQFAGCGGQTTKRILLPSNGFRYETGATPPASPTPAQCAAAIGLIQLNGYDLSPTGTYRVTMNNFLADGGDGFTTFKLGTDVIGGAQDIDALIDYMKPSLTGAPLAPLALKTVAPVLSSDPNRIVSVGSLVSSPEPVVPEAPVALLLPIGALLLLAAAGLFLVRRRPALG